MTTNKPEVFRFDCHGHNAPAYSCNKPADNSGEYVRLSGYETLQAECEKLVEALVEARDLVAEWGGYASEYFKEKHGLEHDIARLDADIAAHRKQQEPKP